MLEARAFEPEFLRKLDRLVLGIKRARTVRSGQRTLGRVQGLGIEPENFREYNEGDDLRFLDWNTYARLDQLSIRTFRAERQVEITMLVDASASMAFPESDDKLGLALALAASLAYVGMSDNDAVRIAAFAMRRWNMHLDSSPFYRRRESYLDFRPFVSAIRTGGETRLGAAVDCGGDYIAAAKRAEQRHSDRGAQCPWDDERSAPGYGLCQRTGDKGCCGEADAARDPVQAEGAPAVGRIVHQPSGADRVVDRAE